MLNKKKKDISEKHMKRELREELKEMKIGEKLFPSLMRRKIQNQNQYEGIDPEVQEEIKKQERIVEKRGVDENAFIEEQMMKAFEDLDKKD